MLRVTSAVLSSDVCLGHEGDSITEVHLIKEKLFKRHKWKRKKKWTGEEGSVMGNRYIRLPHSNCETRTGGFMDILEKWSVIGILFLEVIDLPTTDFPVLQHADILGQCFDTSVCLDCVQPQCFMQGTKEERQEPCCESLTETQLQHSKQHWVFQQWGDCSSQSRDRAENLASNLAVLCTFSWGTLQPRWTNLGCMNRLFLSEIRYQWLKKFLEMVMHRAATPRWMCCCWHGHLHE